ncbi:MAG: alpha/beta hydrolase [Verrucomicrobiota bacterium JB022]|nr:alpha/beta hydrolase [Verrucomicrobiota bacterium JB022]
MEAFQSRYGRIAWWKSGAGEPLVLIHGTPFSHYVWRRIVPVLARHYTVFEWDLLGYGSSEKAPSVAPTLDKQNEVLAELLRHWQLDAPRVLAHDFGGCTALRGWVVSGLRYRQLMLIDPVALSPWGSPFVQHVRQHEPAFAGMPAYMHKALLRAYISSAMSGDLPEVDWEGYLRPWLGPENQAAFYRQIAVMDQRYTDEIRDGLGQVDCPVRLLWGDEDEWIPAKRGAELAAMLPHCELRSVPFAGHLVQEDAPEVVVAEALDFFRT